MKIKNLFKGEGFVNFSSSILAIVCGLLFGLIILLISNPSQAFGGFMMIIQGGFTDGMQGFGQVLYMATPLIMTGLSVGFAFKTGLFNIGASGQFTAGAFAAQKKVNRWNAIAESAAKQSGRGIVPEVLPVMKWKEALEYARQLDVKMIPYEKAAGINATKQLIGSVSFGQSVGIFIGPEGGFEEAEVEAAKAMGAVPVTLGKRILRTETAGMTILSILMYHLERE